MITATELPIDQQGETSSLPPKLPDEVASKQELDNLLQDLEKQKAAALARYVEYPSLLDKTPGEFLQRALAAIRQAQAQGLIDSQLKPIQYLKKMGKNW